MLPAYIIEQLRQRKAHQRERSVQIQLELPVPCDMPDIPASQPPPELDSDASPRGVVIVPVWGEP